MKDETKAKQNKQSKAKKMSMKIFNKSDHLHSVEKEARMEYQQERKLRERVRYTWNYNN
jgi:hypothetical protein